MDIINQLFLLPDGSWKSVIINKQGVFEGQELAPQDCIEVWRQTVYEAFGQYWFSVSRPYVNREMPENKQNGIKVLPEEELVRLRNLKRPPDFVVPKAVNIVDLLGEETWTTLGREPRLQAQASWEAAPPPSYFTKEWEMTASDFGRVLDLLEKK